MCRNSNSRGNSGLTLLEVLVALTVLTVGILGTMACFSVSLKAAGRAKASEDAVAFAQQKLADALCTPVEQLQPANGNTGRYQWALRLRELPYSLVSVTVEVDWLEQGSARQLRLSRVLMPEVEPEDPNQ
jgi:prepilin-type N-terminal cleavage/methylation domain-containing protein